MTPADGPLRQALATPTGKRRYVRRLFARIADRYDLITVLLSYGLDRRWKRRLIRLASIEPGARLLDLATGTGDLALLASRRSGMVVGLDVTVRMVQIAASKPPPPGGWGGVRPCFVGGDMLALPFPDASFDVVTTGYGIRNVPDLGGALDEIARVLRPGGRFFSLDFDRPANAVVRAAYLGYLTIVGSALGLLLHRDPDTYRYIAESVRGYPGSRVVVGMLRDRGFDAAGVLPVLGGLMAIHHAQKRAYTEERSS